MTLISQKNTVISGTLLTSARAVEADVVVTEVMLLVKVTGCSEDRSVSAGGAPPCARWRARGQVAVRFPVQPCEGRARRAGTIRPHFRSPSPAEQRWAGLTAGPGSTDPGPRCVSGACGDPHGERAGRSRRRLDRAADRLRQPARQRQAAPGARSV